MGCWRVLFFYVQLCVTGLFWSYAQTETEDYKTKYLTHFSTGEDGYERQLISDLHEVLERLQHNKFPALSKKHSNLPVCYPGEPCALRKGSRIGKLCDCSLPRTCNSFLHRCF